jgi:hypothetical protein
MQERFKIYDLLVKEFTTYPPSNITPEGLTIIAERLDKRYSYEQVEEAMNQLSYKSKFFPSLAEIVEEIQARVPLVLSEEERKQKEREKAKKQAWIDQQIAMREMAKRM